ncbi:type II restriction endonuclease [Helicobacter pylori Hp H-11]|uniref:GIY-YIG nuclease family protein n=1 Tax=Helicobacter pylori TaxID=210 RepID=UPI00026ACE3C|nr:GIY-YIG nuclease family protein [Helicobacter pylori]EJB87032.1 type II restriction endonuclease [Helicobacter pylori Hp H-11]RVY89372.1 GIY-YIG nuclease family protein [Helicobacter pylori]WRA57019.1 GIY-YIG nuclease family protein [Helicobacter pylori]WRA58426.1 GIY-YIG nuclease family protein [Helicobacter pylori]WRF21736.1 GIY-YIG nuclease family protein [Helicobacter pylori]
MHISGVKTAFKIADVEYVKDSTKLNFNYLKDLKDENNQSLSQNILTQNVARVYLIVVDGEIKKIGGSQADGGIKSTLNIYKDGGVKGRPSIRSFGVWYFLYHTILTGAKIEFYMIYQPNFETQVKGLFGFCAIKDASISYKLLEQACLTDYRNNNNDALPEWNVQEQGKDWPNDIKDEHANITQKAQNREKAIHRKAIDKPSGTLKD